MGRRPDPEIIDVEPPNEPIRPDQGYRVGARISAGNAGRTRLAGTVAIAIVLAGLVFATLGPLGPALPEPPSAPSLAPSIATPLPDVAILRGPAPARPLPVFAGGLRWLDPRTGQISGDPYTAARSGLFVDPAGHGLCVCLEIPWSQDRFVARVTVRRYAATGEEIARATLFELESAEGIISGEPIAVDAAISPDGSRLWIAHVVRAATAWQIGLDRVDLATLRVDASMSLDPVPVPPSDAAGVLVSRAGWAIHRRSTVRINLRISPDGSRLAVLVVAFGRPGLDPQLPRYQAARFVVDARLTPGAPVEVAVPVHDATDDRCDAELSAWATDRHFVTICSRPDGDGVQPFVRIENPGDITREVTVGPPVATDDTDWLLDSERGVLYRWSGLAHVLTRLHVATRGMATLAIDAPGTATGDLARWPDSRPSGPAPWAPLAGPDQRFRGARMAGTADGTVIYALGYRSLADDIGGDRLASTGIWVFDAAGVDLVAHWPPAAQYDEIGFTPGWEHLVTRGLPGADADGSPAAWSTSLRFHDARSGEVVEVLGDVLERSGYVPSILAPNAPVGIAGF